jgi:hypothetical protein
MAMHLMREVTVLSFPAIAREVGVRDHTRVVNGWRKVAGRGGEERFAYDWAAELTREIRTTSRAGLVRGRAEIPLSGSLPENLRVGHADGGVLLGHLPSPVLAHEHTRHPDRALTATGVAEVTLCLDPGDISNEWTPTWSTLALSSDWAPDREARNSSVVHHSSESVPMCTASRRSERSDKTPSRSPAFSASTIWFEHGSDLFFHSAHTKLLSPAMASR